MDFSAAPLDAAAPATPPGEPPPPRAQRAGSGLSQSLGKALEERRAWIASSRSRGELGQSPPVSSKPGVRYTVGPGVDALAERSAVPLRDVVARCLEEWDVTSEDSEESDDFCGWRVGSRAREDSDQDAARVAARPHVDGEVPATIATSGSGRPPGRPREKRSSCRFQ